MAAYTFGTVAVYDPITDAVVENATGGHLVAVKDGTPIPIYDLNDTPISTITSNANGQSSQFKADVLTGLVQFGDVVVTVWANEVGALALTAGGAGAAAAASQVAAEAALASVQAYIAANPGGGVSDHGALSGLTDDDHSQYHTDARGDARYYLKSAVDTAIAAAATSSSAADRDRANHTGESPISSITNLETRLTSIVGAGTLAQRPSTPSNGYIYHASDLGLYGLTMIRSNLTWMSISEMVLNVADAVPGGTPTGTIVRRITSPIWAQSDFVGGAPGATITAVTEPIFNAASGTMTYATVAAGQAAQVAGVNGSLTLPLGGRTDVRVGCYISTAGGGAVPTTTHYVFTFRTGTTNVCDVVIRGTAPNVRKVGARQNFTYPTVANTVETIDDGDRWWVEAHLNGTTFNLEVWTEDNLVPGSAPDYTIGPITTTVGTPDNVVFGNSAASGLTVKHETFRAADGNRMGPQ